jgi:hypothetical protein
MLLRVVLGCGLITPEELTKYYAQGSGGVQSLHQFLVAHGVDVHRLGAIRRAYAETVDFGSALIKHLRNVRHVDDARLRAANRALNACETAQLMAIKKGRRAKPIGEMMVELGHITAAELDQLIINQGMLQRVQRYTEEARQHSSLLGRLGLTDLRRKISAGRVGLACLVCVLALVIFCNLRRGGLIGSTPTREAEIFGKPFDPHDIDQHIKMTMQHYRNMMTELRLKHVSSAKHYRQLLDTYFTALDQAGMPVEDQQMRHIQNVYERLDFEKVYDIPAAEMPKLTDLELEARLRR